MHTQFQIDKRIKCQCNVFCDFLFSDKRIKLVIYALCRTCSPLLPLLLPRECGSSCQVLGFDVPAGTVVFVNAWAIRRDPSSWDKPEEFVPERFEGSGVEFNGRVRERMASFMGSLAIAPAASAGGAGEVQQLVQQSAVAAPAGSSSECGAGVPAHAGAGPQDGRRDHRVAAAAGEAHHRGSHGDRHHPGQLLLARRLAPL